MKKGFTIIELLVTIVIIAIIGGVGIISYNYIFASASGNYYKTIENSLLLSGNDYFEKNREEKPINGYSVVSMDNLIDGNYISPIKDKKGGNCEKGDVYITRNPNNNQYEYEVCLKCLDYESKGNFCKGNIPGSIYINAYLESNGSNYNPLLSYKNVGVIDNDNLKVNISLENDKLSYFSIDKVNNRCEANGNSCEVTITNSGSYLVSAFDKDNKKIADDRVINVKIDRENPRFEIKNDKRYLMASGETKEVEIKIENIKDDIGIRKIEYCIEKENEECTYVNLNNSNNIIKEKKGSGSYKVKVKVTDLVGHYKEEESEFDISYNVKLKYLDESIKNFEVIYGKEYGYLDTLQNAYNNKLIKWVYENTSNEVSNTTEVIKTSEHILEAKYSNTVEIPTSNYCNNMEGKDYVKYTGSNVKLTKEEPFGVSFYNNIGKDVGTYTVKAKLLYGYTWNDGTTEDKNFNCKIDQDIKLDATKGSCNSLTYNGSNQTLASGGSNVTYSNNIGKNATTYTVTATANSGHAFSDGTTSKTLSCTINKAKDATKGSCNSLTYNGGNQTLASGGSNVTYSNNIGKNATTYTVTATANSGHAFSDGTTSKTLSCTINKATPNFATTETSKTVAVGSNATFGVVAYTLGGTLTWRSNNTGIVTIAGDSSTIYKSSGGVNNQVVMTIKGQTAGSSSVSVTFKPSDTVNYSEVTRSVNVTVKNSNSWWYVAAGSGSQATCVAGCSCMCDAKGNSSKCGGPPEGPLATWACGDSVVNNPGSPGTVEGGKCWCYGDKNKWDNFSW